MHTRTHTPANYVMLTNYYYCIHCYKSTAQCTSSFFCNIYTILCIVSYIRIGLAPYMHMKPEEEFSKQGSNHRCHFSPRPNQPDLVIQGVG